MWIRGRDVGLIDLGGSTWFEEGNELCARHGHCSGLLIHLDGLEVEIQGCTHLQAKEVAVETERGGRKESRQRNTQEATGAT